MRIGFIRFLFIPLLIFSFSSCGGGQKSPTRSRTSALTTLTVSLSSDNDPGGFGEAGDLRYALNTMNTSLNTGLIDDYAITFDFPMTIQLNGILPIINNSPYPVDITIGNSGSIATVTIDGNNGEYSGFFIPIGNVTIQNMIFQNLTAKGGNGGDGTSGGGGGLGAGGAIFVPQIFLNGSNPSVTLINVSISNCSAVGGNGGNYFGISSPTGNEGGGGFGGNGGSVTIAGSTGGGGGGAGIGSYDTDYTVQGGGGGLGGGGGGIDQSGITSANGGYSLGGGGGGGGGPSNGSTATGGEDVGSLGGGAGGDGANGVGIGFGGGGGGGGSGIGGAIFVDSNLNFTIQALSGIPTTFNTPNTTTQAGAPGSAGSGGGLDGSSGTAHGNSIFLRRDASLTLVANGADDLLTVGEEVSFTDDTIFGGTGTRVYVNGNGTVVYNGTSDYQGSIRINNANFKVNGQIDQASVVIHNVGISSQYGTLSGSGSLTGSVAVVNGTISPDAGETLTLGALTLTSSPSLVHIGIDSNGTSLVSVTDTATLAGTLEIDLDSDAVPGTYTILTSSGITGTFDSIEFTGETPTYTISYLPVGAPTYVQFTFTGFPTSESDATSVSGSGSFTSGSGTIQFNISAAYNSNNQIVASMYYNDTGTGIHFDNPVVTSLNFSSNQVTLGGSVRVLGNNPENVTFTVTLTGTDEISVTMSNGYSASGTLSSGSISTQ